jgi:aminocarboxymuconate-semialdehyde decarboxylase
MTVFVHPTNSKAQPRMEPYHLTNCIGNLVDTSIALDRLILTGVLLRYPNIRFYFAHAGGFVPFQYGRVDHAWRVRQDTSSVIDVLPSSLLSSVWFDTITHAPGSLRYLIDAMGDERVVVGTDYPADMADAHIAETLGSIGLSDESRARVEHESAQRLFGQPVGAEVLAAAAE